MTFRHGKDAEVWVGAADLSTYFRSMEFSVDVETADTTTFKSSWKSALPGTPNSVVDLEGLFDPTNDDITDLLPSTATVLSIMPSGGSIGNLARLVSIRTTAYAEAAPVGDVVTFNWSVTSDGLVGIGQVLHPFGEDTDTTTGATKNDGASSSTGWSAHLHVSAVDGGSWVVKLEDASASNFSDGADVTGGAFSAATGATSQRLVSASGATLRRYVRYVATRTGGTGGDGITFGLTYSR